MTRSELIQRIALRHPHLTERDVRVAVKMLLEQMTACLADGGRIEIRGVGALAASRSVSGLRESHATP